MKAKVNVFAKPHSKSFHTTVRYVEHDRYLVAVW